MHSFIYLQTPNELPQGPDVLHLYPDPSLNIEQVRQAQSFLSRRPLQSLFNLVVFHQAELLTLPAQHALLKTLEEPPGFAQIWLITPNPESLLPTVLSRVQITGAPPAPPSIEEINQSFSLFTQLSTSSLGKRLLLVSAQDFTRPLALQFFTHIEYALLQNPTPASLPTLITFISEVKTRLQANANLRLCLNDFALKIT